MKTSFLATAACLLALAAVVAASTRVFPEADTEFTYSDRGWVDLGEVAGDEVLQVTFALKQSHKAELLRRFHEVSDPASRNYGRHLSHEEVTALVAPSDDVVPTILAFLREHAGQRVRHSVNLHRDSLIVEVPAGAAYALFGVVMHRFAASEQYPGISETFLRAVKHYSVPAHIAELIDFVAGLNRLPDLRLGGSMKPSRSYAVPQMKTAVPSNASQVLASFGGATQSVIVLPKCGDGSVFSDFSACSKAGAVESISVSIQSVTPRVGPAATNSFDATSLSKYCQPCASYKPTALFGNTVAQVCTGYLTHMGVAKPDSVLVCLLPVEDVALCSNSSFVSATTFADGSKATGAAFNTYVEPDVTPEWIRSQYVVSDTGATGSNVGSQAVAEFLKQYYSPADLAAYFAQFDVPTTAGSVTLQGYNVPSAPGGEASLDIQVIMGVAPTVPTTFWSTTGIRNNTAPPSNSNQEPFFRWISAVLDETNPPLVHSSSYSDREEVMPRPFTDRLNVEFVKAGARGLSLFFATGDDGASGILCRTGNCSALRPTFPPTSPYVTSVGGTQMDRPMGGAISEVTADSATGSFITSGGAFSQRYAMPDYQSYDVNQYLTSGVALPPASLYNASGRAYPDVSAISTNFIIYQFGSQEPIGGTSASTPTTAAIFSLLNQVRMQLGWSPLGFMNPLLYSLNTLAIPFFNDIVFGNNKCSAVFPSCSEYGFEAYIGWDACTGLGSPNFSLLRAGVLPSQGAFTTNTQDGKFKIDSVAMYAPEGVWGPDVSALVVVKGVATDMVMSGDVAFKVYENGVKSSVSSGAASYFECNNKACDPSQPVALNLQTPTETGSNFTLKFSFRMPPKTVSGEFRLSATGVDQAGSDFNIEIGYNFTSSA